MSKISEGETIQVTMYADGSDYKYLKLIELKLGASVNRNGELMDDFCGRDMFVTGVSDCCSIIEFIIRD